MCAGTRTGQTVLITGCSAGGLGESLALAFHGRGCRVLATARRLSSMRCLSEAGIHNFELDVTSAADIATARMRIEQLGGGTLDILVNNAGQSHPSAVADASMDDVRAVFDVNFFGALAMVQSFLPLLLASENACIVQIGSISGVAPTPFGAEYNASKAALHSLSDTLRMELAPLNIKVIIVALGNVKTGITKSWQPLPENSLYRPIKVYHQRLMDHFMDFAHSRESVARAIVSEVLKNDPAHAWLWLGQNAWVFWFVDRFLGRRLLEWLLSFIFGLSKLAAIKALERKQD